MPRTSNFFFGAPGSFLVKVRFLRRSDFSTRQEKGPRAEAARREEAYSLFLVNRSRKRFRATKVGGLSVSPYHFFDEFESRAGQANLPFSEPTDPEPRGPKLRDGASSVWLRSLQPAGA